MAFVEQALCVHEGWHYTSHRIHGQRPGYVLWGHGYWRTWNVPDYLAGGSGEGAWSGIVGDEYGGGMSFTVGTWNRAARASGGDVPSTYSTKGIASQPAAVQIEAAYLVVSGDRSWGEWPQTSRACGYD